MNPAKPIRDPVAEGAALVEPTPEQIYEWRTIAAASAPALARFENRLAVLSGYADQRLAVQGAVNATLELLLSVPRLSPGVALLSELCNVFQDVDDGILSPLVTPKAQSHRPFAPTAERTLRAAAAATMQLLMKCLGYGKKEAARTVADELQRLKFPVGKGLEEATAAGTIASWRDQASAGGGGHLYRKMLEFMKPRMLERLNSGVDQQTLKKDLLIWLASVCPQKKIYTTPTVSSITRTSTSAS